MITLFLLSTILLSDAAPAVPVRLEPGDYVRQLAVDGRERSYLLHVPKGYDGTKPTPLVVAFHGAFMSGQSMSFYSGLNAKADQETFLVAYPNGTGPGDRALFFNAGLFAAPLSDELPDDVKFTARLLDDVASAVRVDSRRVYATGMSNGGMMCYRLAAELSDRIAAIAPVSGTLALDRYEPKRRVPVLHFHGTDDRVVPFEGPSGETPTFVRFKSVADTMRRCCTTNNCAEKPETTRLADRFDDGTTVERRVFAPKPEGAEVILYVVRGGGHTWPGRERLIPNGLIGATSREISANDLMWEFFTRHALP